MANSQRLYILNHQDVASIYECPKFNDSERRHIQKEAYKLLEKNTIIHLSKVLSNDNQPDVETALIWEFHKNNYRCILLNLRPLFIALDFETSGTSENIENISNAIRYLKEIFENNKKLSSIDPALTPIAHVHPKKLQNYFIEKNSDKSKFINIYQYEFYLYNIIRNNIKNGQIYINNSLEYKSFTTDLKISPQWETDKNQILQKLNNPVLLKDIKDTLLYLENQLEPLIIRVNERALNGDNKHIKIKHHRNGTVSWTIPYPKKNSESDNPFYNKIEPITISEAYDFIAQRCEFYKAFKHIKPHYARSKLDLN